MSGLHHVTAITGDPGSNLSFYTDLLGLRLVKRTVNHDAPDTWHLYYGGRTGRPGTTLTFFVWPELPQGRAGAGKATVVSFAVPADALPYWTRRLADRGVEADRDKTIGGRPALAFADPDGLRLRLVGVEDPRGETPGGHGPVPEEHAVRGFHDVVLAVREPASTASVLEEALGFRRRGGSGDGSTDGGAGPAAAEGESSPSGRAGRILLEADGPGPGRRVEVAGGPAEPEGRRGAGTVHHVAFRAADEEEQEEIRGALAERGLGPTPPVDRYYFRSVYAREPGGVLVEVATDGPGFTRDEDAADLGRALALPPWLETRRDEIEEALPPLEEGP